jgi:hypothetical protein
VGRNKQGPGQNWVRVLRGTMCAGLAARPIASAVSVAEASYVLSGSGREVSMTRSDRGHSP